METPVKPWQLLVPLVVLLSLSLTAGCGSGERRDAEGLAPTPAGTPQPVTPAPWTGDVSGLTLDDVRSRALAALSREGFVYHVIQRGEFQANGQTQDARTESWLDLARDLGRRDEHFQGAVRTEIYYRGRHASWNLDTSAMEDYPIEWAGLDWTSAAAVPHVQMLFAYDVTGSTLSTETVDGMRLLVVEITTHYETTTVSRLFLDGSYLPVRLDSRVFLGDTMTLGGEGSGRFENQFVPLESLPSDFFSPDNAGKTAE